MYLLHQFSYTLKQDNLALMHIDCASIADLPTGDSISDDRNRIYVTLPLVCLGMFKGGMKCAFLLVTDFTAQPSSTVFGNLLPLPVLTEYEFGGQQLDRAKVFSISIAGPYIERCWAELGKFTPNMLRYNYYSTTTNDFSNEGVVALINFRVQQHFTQKSKIEGFYSRMTVCNREMLSRPLNLPKYDDKIFLDMMARYVQHMNIEHYDHLVRNFPVEKYVQRTVLLGRERERQEQMRRRRDAERGKMERERMERDKMEGEREQRIDLKIVKSDIITQAPPAKVRRLMGAQVTFQQHFTQPDQTESPESDSEEYFDTTTPSNGTESEGRTTNERRGIHNGHENEAGLPAENGSGHRGGSYGGFSSTKQSSEKVLLQHNGTTQQQWNHFSIHEVDFATLARVACYTLSVGTCFTTTCHVHEIRPLPRQVFVKPFRRTMKIAPITIFLTQGTDLVKVELHTEEEKCKFLGLEETEEAIGRIDELAAGLERLVGAQVEIGIEKRTMALDFGYERSYWSSGTSLKKMIGGAAWAAK